MLSSKEFSHLPVLLLLEDFAQDFPSCASIFHLHLVSPSFQAGAINDGSLPSTAVRIFLFSAATETFDPTTSKISSHTISPCPFSYQGKEINSFLWCWQCKVTRPSAVKLWNVLLAPSSFTTGLQHRAASSCPSQPAGGTGLSRLSLPEWPGGVTALGNAQGHPAPAQPRRLTPMASLASSCTCDCSEHFMGAPSHTHGQSHTNPPDLLSSLGKATDKPLINH